MNYNYSTRNFLREQAQRQRVEQARQHQLEVESLTQGPPISKDNAPLFPDPVKVSLMNKGISFFKDLNIKCQN